jgi:hypothetical protein
MRRLRTLLLILLPAVAALTCLSAARSWVEERADVGFALEARDARVVVADVDRNGPASRAGLRVGDRVISIAGVPVPSLLVGRDLLARTRPGASIGLVVVRNGEPASVAVRSVAQRRWVVRHVVATIVGVAFLFGAGAVLARPRASITVVIYAGWCLAGALMLGATWSARDGTAVDWILFWSDRVARLLLPALWLHLALSIKRDAGATRRRWAPVIYAPAVALLVTELHLVGFQAALASSSPVALLDALQSRVELVWMLLGFTVGTALLVAPARRARDLDDRARARWAVFGAIVGLAPVSLLTLIPQIVLGDEPSWSWAGLPFFACVPLIFTGAVLDYRLMDLALFIRRATEVAVVLVLSSLLFVGLLEVSNLVLPNVLHPPGLVPALVAGLLTLVLAPAVRAASRDVVGRIYYRHRYNFRRALRRVARDLNACKSLPELAANLERRVGEALGVGTARLFLVQDTQILVDPTTGTPVRDMLSASSAERFENGQTISLAILPDAPRLMPGLHRDGVQVLVPLRVDGRLIAVLAVGPRTSGGLLDSDDIDLLKSISAHAAAAVAAVLHLAELEQQVELVRQLQERTAALIESSPMGMVCVDGRGVVRHWNPAVSELFGKSLEQALGRRYDAVLPAQLCAAVDAALSTARREGRTRAFRLRFLDEDEDVEKRVNLSAAPLVTLEGDDGVLLTFDDITSRARLEEQLIQQDRLASVGLLAAGVAHEVNTPLTGISSYAQMLLAESDPNDPRRELLDKIVTQAGRASRIARGLLTISRPRSAGGEQRLAVVRERVDLADVVDETLSLIALQIRKAGAEVEHVREDGRAVVFGDRSRLQQVVMNLLLNALDAIDSGGAVVVRAGGTRIRHGQAGVVLDVTDDGPGIPEEIRDRIFDPFFTTKAAGQGTGLGLSISYSIVREHGGELVAEPATPSGGTRMRVVLPAAGDEFASSDEEAIGALRTLRDVSAS